MAKSDDTIVIELSSFQLMGIEEFRPEIAIVTNLYDAHLDYHGSKREYAEAKAAITKNQTGLISLSIMLTKKMLEKWQPIRLLS